MKNMRALLREDPSRHHPGLAASAEAEIGQEDEYAKMVLDACFAVKSPNTLLKRYYAIKAYCDWLQLMGYVCWLPLSELVAWHYIRDLHSSNRSPSKAASFVEAVRFLYFVVKV